MSDSARDLLVRGIAAAKAGERREAVRYLEWALNQDATAEQRIQAWYWLSECSEDVGQKRYYLQQVLSADPNYQPARRGLAILDGRLKPDAIVDPNRLPGVQLQAGADARRFVCPTCGGRLTYAPDGKSLTCESCEVQQRWLPTQFSDASTGADGSQDFTVAMATLSGHALPSLERPVTCQSCGAPFTLDADDLSAACPYCATVYVIEKSSNGAVYGVQALIPFGVSRQQALDALHTWLLSLRVAGRVQVTGLRGGYLPAWLFWIGLPTAVQQPFAGPGDFAAAGELIVVPACRGLPKAWEAAFGAFDWSQLTAFDPAFLANWQAETYQVSLSDASLAARFAARNRIHQAGWSGRAISSLDLQIFAFRLALLPFWRATYRQESAENDVLINGQSGQIWD